jgi:lysozyme family protein
VDNEFRGEVVNEFERILPGLLRREGGLVDDPDDPGGVTKFGISLRAHPELGREGIVELSEEDAGEIYRLDYWEPMKCDRLSLPKALVLFDFAVHSGNRRATIEAQRVVDVEDDGVFGPITLAAVVRSPTAVFCPELQFARVRYLHAIVTGRPESRKFFRGWIGRLLHVDDELGPLLASTRVKRSRSVFR